MIEPKVFSKKFAFSFISVFAFVLFIIFTAMYFKYPNAALTVDLDQVCKPIIEMSAQSEGSHKYDSTVINQIYQFTKMHPECDEFSLHAEAISDLISESIANDFEKSIALIATRPELEPLIYKHIDSLESDQTLNQILNNSKQKCPANQSKLCKKIAAAANDALEDSHGIAP